MSTTMATVDQNIRDRLRDLKKGSDPLLDQDELRKAIMDNALELGHRAGLGETWTTSFLSTGTARDVAISTASIYGTIKKLRIQQTGQIIERIAESVMEDLWSGVVDTQGGGTPEVFALWESSTQALTARFWPRPDTNRACDALISTLPTAAYTDATVIPFSPLLQIALEKKTAIEMFAKLPKDEHLAGIISESVLAVWAKDVDAALAEEVKRQGRLKRPTGFVRTRIY